MSQIKPYQPTYEMSLGEISPFPNVTLVLFRRGHKPPDEVAHQITHPWAHGFRSKEEWEELLQQIADHNGSFLVYFDVGSAGCKVDPTQISIVPALGIGHDTLTGAPVVVANYDWLVRDYLLEQEPARFDIIPGNGPATPESYKQIKFVLFAKGKGPQGVDANKVTHPWLHGISPVLWLAMVQEMSEDFGSFLICNHDGSWTMVRSGTLYVLPVDPPAEPDLSSPTGGYSVAELNKLFK